ncbi:LOW QUALITY PROTEIN: hypothetical protein ACHAXR_002248 [Thalassiosira sp. AJA248-18]
MNDSPFGPPKENFNLLQEMASVLPRGEFQNLGLNASNLKTAFSSLSSMTDLRTEGGSCMLTPQLDKVVDKNQKIDSSKVELFGQEGWWIYSNADFLGKYQLELEDGTDKLKLKKLKLDNGVTGLAFVSQPFEKGAERLVHICAEIEILNYAEGWYHGARHDENVALRASAGLHLVAKEAKVEENLRKGRKFHETFARIQQEASDLAKKFCQRLPPPSPNMWKVSFILTFIYCCEDTNTHYLNEKCWLLCEPELEGKFTKWNNNGGEVKTKTQTTHVNQSLGIGMGFIEEGDEDSEEMEGILK